MSETMEKDVRDAKMVIPEPLSREDGDTDSEWDLDAEIQMEADFVKDLASEQIYVTYKFFKIDFIVTECRKRLASPDGNRPTELGL